MSLEQLNQQSMILRDITSEIRRAGSFVAVTNNQIGKRATRGVGKPSSFSNVRKAMSAVAKRLVAQPAKQLQKGMTARARLASPLSPEYQMGGTEQPASQQQQQPSPQDILKSASLLAGAVALSKTDFSSLVSGMLSRIITKDIADKIEERAESISNDLDGAKEDVGILEKILGMAKPKDQPPKIEPPKTEIPKAEIPKAEPPKPTQQAIIPPKIEEPPKAQEPPKLEEAPKIEPPSPKPTPQVKIPPKLEEPPKTQEPPKLEEAPKIEPLPKPIQQVKVPPKIEEPSRYGEQPPKLEEPPKIEPLPPKPKELPKAEPPTKPQPVPPKKPLEEAKGVGRPPFVQKPSVSFPTPTPSLTVDFIRRKEGKYFEKATWDNIAYGIGYGHLIRPEEIKQGYIDVGGGDRVAVSGEEGKNTTITKEQAEKLLAKDVKVYEDRAAASLGDTWNKLSDSQKAALTSYAYNTGGIADLVKAGLKDAIVAGDTEKAAKIIEGGKKTVGKKYSTGLADRRKEEADLFRSETKQPQPTRKPKVSSFDKERIDTPTSNEGERQEPSQLASTPNLAQPTETKQAALEPGAEQGRSLDSRSALVAYEQQKQSEEAPPVINVVDNSTIVNQRRQVPPQISNPSIRYSSLT